MKKEEKGFRLSEKIFLALCVVGLIPTLSYLTNFLGFQTLVNSHYTEYQQVTFLGSIIILMFFAMVVFTIYKIVQTIKNEKEAKKFRKSITVGDSVNYTSISGIPIEGQILSVDGDKVKMVVEVFKSRVYPNT